MTRFSRLARLRSKLAPVLKSGLLESPAYSVLRRVAPSRQVAILRYHAICDPATATYADPSICVSPVAFAAHVRYLAAHYAVLPLPDVVERIRDRRAFPRNAVSITFDDGYADNLSAARELARAGLSATFYITSGCLRGGQPFWLSEVRMLVAAATDPTLLLTDTDGDRVVDVSTSVARQRAVRIISRMMKSRTITQRESLRQQLRDLVGNPELPSPMLSWDDLREMCRLGMTIGAHTVTHANLPSAGPTDARTEIVGSRRLLEENLGSRVTMFSYPNGGAERYFDKALMSEVASAGFDAATTSENGFAGIGSDLYALRRTQVAERLEDLAFALEVERFAFAPAERR